MKRIIVILLLALSATAWADGVGEGKYAPDFDKKATLASGKKFKIKSLRGKWVVMTIGASWCKPCRKEWPAWDKLAAEYKGKVTFIAVNIDNDHGKATSFLKKLKIKNLKVVFSPQDKTNTADAYLGGDDPKFPTTFVINPSGVIKHVHQEYHDGDADKLSAKLDALLSDE